MQPVTHSDISRSRCTVEQLENRAMFAVSVIPSDTPTPAPTTGTVARRTPRAAIEAVTPKTIYFSTQSQKITVLDASFGAGTPSGLGEAYWTGNPVWTPQGNGVTDTSEPVVKNLADLVRDGGKVPFSTRVLKPHTFTVIDIEASSLNTQPAAYWEERLSWFRKYAPDEQISLFGYDLGLGGVNRDYVINPTAATKQKMVEQTLAKTGVINYLDTINISAYLLGPQYIERDLKSLAAISSFYREMFPNKPLTAFAWGLYHPMYAINAYIPDDVLKRYIDTLRQNFDGIVLWGSHEDNANLSQLLKDPANQTRLPKTAPLSASAAPLSASVFSSTSIADDVLGQAA